MEIGNIRDCDPKTLYVISEEVINWFATSETSGISTYDKSTNDIFDKVMKGADAFRVAGLTPLYLADEAGSKLFVTSREFLSKMMH